MRHWILHYWERLGSSYWFLPAVMTALAAGLALLLIWLDRLLGDQWLGSGWIYSGSAEGARQLLATVAGSMVTVAGVVFSVMIVALSLASSQFGPRLLRNYMRDRGNQITLGTFIATFVYCLLVLRTVRGENGGDFVPQLSVSGAVLLALAGVGVLIYFLHHAAVSVQAPNVIASVSHELKRSIDSIFPEDLGEPAENYAGQRARQEIPADFDHVAHPVRSKDDGYVQAINGELLLEIAGQRDLLIRIVHRPGKFVVAEDPLALVWPARSAAEEPIRRAFIVGAEQTSEQDVGFVIAQLVEVAVRALSPGVNDPFTAFNCLDHLGAGLTRLASRKIPSPYRRDDQGRLRVIADPVTMVELTGLAFDPIRQYARSQADVLRRMLQVIGTLLGHTRRVEDEEALLRHVLLIEQCAEDLPQEADRQHVRDQCMKALGRRRQRPEPAGARCDGEAC